MSSATATDNYVNGGFGPRFLVDHAFRALAPTNFRSHAAKKITRKALQVLTGLKRVYMTTQALTVRW